MQSLTDFSTPEELEPAVDVARTAAVAIGSERPYDDVSSPIGHRTELHLVGD